MRLDQALAEAEKIEEQVQLNMFSVKEIFSLDNQQAVWQDCFNDDGQSEDDSELKPTVIDRVVVKRKRQAPKKDREGQIVEK